MTGKQILRAADVACTLGVSLPCLYRWIKDERFPRGVRYGPNVVGWPRETVEKWIADKTAAGSVAR